MRCLKLNELNVAFRKIGCFMRNIALGKDFSNFNSRCCVVMELEKSFNINLGENGKINDLIRKNIR